MANERKRIKVLGEVAELTDNHYFIVDDAGTGGATKKYNSSHITDQIRATMAKGTASGAVATFTDGLDGIPMTDLVVSIEPHQDLHGYDSPWVGGAGKNKLPMTVEGIKEANISGSWNENAYTVNGVTFTIQIDSDGNVIGIKVNGTASANVELNLPNANNPLTPTVLSGCPSNGSASTYFLTIQQYNGSDQWGARGSDYGSGVYYNGTSYTYLSSWITIKSGYTANNLLFRPMIRLASVTDATFEPYSNECPISGWTACNVVRAGENLFDKATITENKIIDSTTGEEIVFYGRFSSDYIKVNPSTDYYASNVIRGAKWYCVFYYDKNKNYLSCGELPSTGDNASGVVTTPSGCNYVRLVGVSTYKDDVSFVVGNQAPSSYSAYNGNTYTINFVDGSSPLTVYGGSLDVLSGVLTVDRAYANMGDLSWTKPSNYTKIFYAQPSNVKTGVSGQIQTICSQYPSVACNDFSTLDTYYDKVVTIQKNASSIVVVDSGYSSASDFKTAMNGVQLVYELATPQTYQLTPTEVKSLLGVNNIFADTGNVLNAEYVRDTTTIINQILARLDALESQKGDKL